MLTKFKKSFTIALAVVMCLSTVCASAATWRIKDYDNLNVAANMVRVVYEEIDDAGRFTGRMAMANPNVEDRQNWYGMAILDTTDPAFIAKYPAAKPFAKTELKDYWFDAYYTTGLGNAEYGSVYADGKYIGRVEATNRYGKWGLVNYKDVDYTWEVAAPFAIYSIEKAWLNIGGVPQWFGTEEMNYPVKLTGRNADVKVQKPQYGFGVYNVVNGKVVDLMPDVVEYDNDGYLVQFDINKVLDTCAHGVGPFVNPDVNSVVGLSATDLLPTVNAPVAPKMLNSWKAYTTNYGDLGAGNWDVIDNIEIKIPRTYEYTLVGPAFDANGVATPFAKTIRATKYAGDLCDFGYQNLIDVQRDRFTNELQYCEITWTPGGYENASPHPLYAYLTIDGVVMDGSAIEVPFGDKHTAKVYLPCIAAYTGAVANVY
ncbi:MAG: hypothetical protein E7395_06705 [Ruminococcaceae bacterium]|nr:hypothetical protein [Oscillospiraceae bacterium]